MTRPDFVAYSCFDAQGTWLLWQKLRTHLEGMEWQHGRTLYSFYTTYWRPFGELLTDMERAGAPRAPRAPPPLPPPPAARRLARRWRSMRG